VQQLGALVAAALRVDEDEHRLGLLRWNRLDDEDLATGRRLGPRRRDDFEAAADRHRPSAVAARRTAATSATVSLFHRRFPTTSN